MFIDVQERMDGCGVWSKVSRMNHISDKSHCTGTWLWWTCPDMFMAYSISSVVHGQYLKSTVLMLCVNLMTWDWGFQGSEDLRCGLLGCGINVVMW